MSCCYGDTVSIAFLQVLCVCYLELHLREFPLCNNLSKLHNHPQSNVEEIFVYDSKAQ